MNAFDVLCERRWGGKRGLLRHLGWRAFSMVGGMRRLRAIDWTRVGRLVFVCSGNICRSPYAAARARSRGLVALSFGLDADERAGADARAIAVAHGRGVDLSTTRARSATAVQLTDTDLLVAMEPAHLQPLQSMADRCRCQVTLLGLWARPEQPYIGDPLARSEAFFTCCYAAIDSGIEGLRRELSTCLARA
jgi:protein-tyrosine-phosphatase